MTTQVKHRSLPGQSVPALATSPEWVICLGTEREVGADGVRCGVSASPVTVADCLACRHLATVSDERVAANSCTTAEFEGEREGW
jgi:hypothetical protein